MPVALIIPTYSNADYYSRTTLDGRDFNLRFQWNQYESRWALSIFDETGDVLLAGGLKLVCNVPLLRAYHYDERLPPGELVVVDQTLDGSPPGLEDLGEGKRCTLTYASPNSL